MVRRLEDIRALSANDGGVAVMPSGVQPAQIRTSKKGRRRPALGCRLQIEQKSER
jgi:hypothetical protein